MLLAGRGNWRNLSGLAGLWALPFSFAKDMIKKILKESKMRRSIMARGMSGAGSSFRVE